MNYVRRRTTSDCRDDGTDHGDDDDDGGEEMQTDTRPAVATATGPGAEPPAGTSEAGSSRDDAGRGGGQGARGGDDKMATASTDATAASGDRRHTAEPSEATAMDEDEVDMECDEGGGGAGSSSGRQAARDLGFDVDEEEVRATSGTSARLAAQADEQVGVKKKDRGKRKGGTRRRREKAGQAAGVDGHSAAVSGFTPDTHSQGDEASR